jgi:GT2 family glycosyltransferase
MNPPLNPETSVAVIILTYNQREKTLRCLEHLARASLAHDTVVWDNGSSDGTVEAVQAAYPSVVAHASSVNLGVASGRNAGAQLAIARFQPSHLLFLDNDIYIEPDFIAQLLRPFADDPQLGQTQAKLRFVSDPDRINYGGGINVRFVMGTTRPIGYGELDQGQYDQPVRCVACGGAMMVRAELFQRLGGFDAIFDPFGPEDLDFSLRVRKAGAYALFVPQAVGYHEVSHTFEPGNFSEKYARHKSRHWFNFMHRHASPLQQAGFYLIGAPYRMARVLIREGRKGNFGAVRGLVRGAADLLRASTHSRS